MIEERRQKKASKTQTLGFGILATTLVLSMAIGFYMMRDVKVNKLS